MANKTYKDHLLGIIRRLVDIGNGEHADVVVAVNADGSTIGGTALTDAQLRAAAVGVQAQSRLVIAQQTITAPITNGVTLASLLPGAIIPIGAVVAEIQAIGGAVRIGLKNGTTVTPVTGYKIDIGAEKAIDTTLADVTIVAESAAALCNVTFYDRV